MKEMKTKGLFALMVAATLLCGCSKHTVVTTTRDELVHSENYAFDVTDLLDYWMEKEAHETAHPGIPFDYMAYESTDNAPAIQEDVYDRAGFLVEARYYSASHELEERFVLTRADSIRYKGRATPYVDTIVTTYFPDTSVMFVRYVNVYDKNGDPLRMDFYKRLRNHPDEHLVRRVLYEYDDKHHQMRHEVKHVMKDGSFRTTALTKSERRRE